MRTFAVLTLLAVFVLAVILPNDIGTHELPATGCKCIKAGPHQLVKGKAVTSFVAFLERCDASPTKDAQLLAYRSAQTATIVQHSSPLLI